MASNADPISDEALELRRLVKGADSIELTLPEYSYRSAAAQCIFTDREQQTKTKTALEFFSSELHAG